MLGWEQPDYRQAPRRVHLFSTAASLRKEEAS